MSDFDDFDDLELQADEESDDHVRLSKADLKRLRAAAKRAGAAERDLATYRRQATVRKAGLEGLSERQLNALAAEAGDDADDTQLHALAVEFGWAKAPEASVEEQQREAELNGQHQAAQVANGAEPPAQRTDIPPEDVAGWPVDKQMRLNEHHPELFELALQGQPISLPPGFN